MTLGLSLSAFAITTDEKIYNCMEMRYQNEMVLCLRQVGVSLAEERDACIDVRFKKMIELGSQYRRATIVSFETARMICKRDSFKNPVREQNCINGELIKHIEEICN